MGVVIVPLSCLSAFLLTEFYALLRQHSRISINRQKRERQCQRCPDQDGSKMDAFGLTLSNREAFDSTVSRGARPI